MNPTSISTAISYPNAKPHLGHALEFVQADFLARYYRLQGNSVFFQTGLDEHGQKIFRTATEAGLEPKAFVDGQEHLFKDLLVALQVVPDRFIRTTDVDHVAMAQAMWRKCFDAGDIYKKTYRAWYNVKEEEFLASANDVKDPSTFGIDMKFIELIEEENYFFCLSKYSDKLKDILETKTYAVVPDNRAHEVLNFVKSGLQDVSISREKNKLPWGIPVPDDDSQIMYVWFDALVNYLTGTATLEADNIVPNQFWPYSLHCVGKDIARFHAVMWPAMLLSAGLELPHQLLVHGFILSDGRKMSKSTGNVVDPHEAITVAGSDATRWYLLAEIQTLDDGDFTLERLRAVYDSDLANDFGNVVSRVVAMCKKYCDGSVPGVAVEQVQNLEKTLITEAWQEYHDFIAARQIDKALAVVKGMVVFCNRRIEEQKPWAMAKEENKKADLEELLYELIELIRHISVMLLPAMPETIEKLHATVFAGIEDSVCHSEVWGKTPPRLRLPEEGVILFPRLES